MPPRPDRAAIAAAIRPRLRGLMAGARTKVGHFSDDPEALEGVRQDFAGQFGTDVVR